MESLPGLGPVSAERLGERGIHTVEDLLFWLPSTYDDLRRAVDLTALQVGVVQLIEGCVKSVRRFGPKWRKGLEVVLEQDGALLRLLFFRMHPGLERRYVVGARVVVSGRVDQGKKGLQISHPVFEEGAGAGLGLRARYTAIKGVKAAALQKARRAALALPGSDLTVGIVRDGVSLRDALSYIHHPPPELTDGLLSSLRSHDSEAHRRIHYEKVFRWVAARRLRVQHFEGREGMRIRSDGAGAELLGLVFSRDQREALEAIRVDLASGRAMRRLLMGDVGSGKTAVAMLLVRDVVAAGGRVALMAPSAVLAEALYRRFNEHAKALGLRPALLLGEMTESQRRDVESRLRGGDIDLLIGTHILSSETLRTGAFSLVVIDEQHRFGVAQRLRLAERGEGRRAPHLLAMSATPIPRSLALTLCGELQVSLLRERPAGERRVTTELRLMSERAEEELGWVEEVSQGGKVLVICSRVGGEAASGRVGVEEVAERLGARLSPEQVAVLHGRQDGEERRAAVRAFSEGSGAVLVSSTVVEVGLDIPGITRMSILNAECFGLSQLHQLRGRMGRRGERGLCVLLYDESAGEAARARLQTLVDCDDGFAIAEHDLRLRGSGALLGTRQSGGFGIEGVPFEQAVPWVEEATEAVERIFRDDPDLSRSRNQGFRQVLERFARGGLMFEPAAGG